MKPKNMTDEQLSKAIKDTLRELQTASGYRLSDMRVRLNRLYKEMHNRRNGSK